MKWKRTFDYRTVASRLGTELRAMKAENLIQKYRDPPLAETMFEPRWLSTDASANRRVIANI